MKRVADRTAEENARLQASEARLAGAKERLREAKKTASERAEQIPHEPKAQPALRHADGTILTTQEILDHMKENGVDSVGFVSHKDNPGNAQFLSTNRGVSREDKVRSGKSYAKGNLDHSTEAMQDQLVRDASKVAQHEVHSQHVREYAAFTGQTPQEVQHGIDNFRVDEEGGLVKDPFGKDGLVVVNMRTGRVVQAAAARAGELGADATNAELSQTLSQFGLHEHSPIASSTSGDEYAAVPQMVLDRMEAHENAVSAKDNVVKRNFQRFTQLFRRIAFALSAKHAGGLVEENAIRRLTEFGGNMISSHYARRAGASLERALSQLAGHDENGVLADEFGPLGQEYRRLEGVLAGRKGLAGAMRDQQIYRAWSDDTVGGRAVNRAKQTLGAKMWREYYTHTEATLAELGHHTGNAMLGKALKDSGFVDTWKSVLGDQDKLMKQLVEDKLNMNDAIALAKRVDDMAGNWNHLTPLVKGAVSSYTPFGLWWLNSARWLYRMPFTPR